MEHTYYSKVPRSYLVLFLLLVMLITILEILRFSTLAFIVSITNNFHVTVYFFLLLLWIVFFIYFFFYTIDLILWNIKGYEEITITEKNFKIIKRGRLINKEVCIELSKIRSIEEQKCLYTTFFSHTHILFLYAIGERGGEIWYNGQKWLVK